MNGDRVKMVEKQVAAPNEARYSSWFMLIVAIFITCLITANITAVKLVNVFGLMLPAGIIIFPISYIFGDVLTEVYGYRQARRVIWLGFFCNFIAVVAIWLGQVLPSASFRGGQSSYEAAVTPLTYGAVGFLKQREGIDVYDYDTRFNPLFLSEQQAIRSM